MGFSLLHDGRMAARALRGSPVVSVLVVVSLGLALGANAAIFSIANSLLLRPLPSRPFLRRSARPRCDERTSGRW